MRLAALIQSASARRIHAALVVLVLAASGFAPVSLAESRRKSFTSHQNHAQQQQQQLQERQKTQALTEQEKKDLEFYSEAAGFFGSLATTMKDGKDGDLAGLNDDAKKWVAVFDNIAALINDGALPPPASREALLAYGKKVLAMASTVVDGDNLFKNNGPDEKLYKKKRVDLLVEALGIEADEKKREEFAKVWDSPVVLDKDRDGRITLVSPEAGGVHFDLKGGGVRRSVGWLGPDDAFVAVDLNGDGVINDGRELFGNNTLDLASKKPAFAEGFAALRQYDSDKDGEISAADVAWPRLLCWQDANTNGISEPRELTSLDACGVRSIKVGKGDIVALEPDAALFENSIRFRSRFVATDGRAYDVVDAFFFYGSWSALNAAIQGP